MEPINTNVTNPSTEHTSSLEMEVISPTTSNDASIASDEQEQEQLTTPPPSTRQSLETDTETRTSTRHHYLSEDPIIASGSYKPKYNFASLNKLKKASPPSPGGPKFDEPVPITAPSVPIPSPSPSAPAPSSPSKKTTASSTPYTRPAGSMMISGLQRNTNLTPGSNGGITALRPMTPANPNPNPKLEGRPQVSMPKSQPLSRTLFKNGQTNKPAKPQKLIVPKKPFKTVFELPLTSSEFARRDW